jgi:signal transduction histidine kinase
LRSITLKLVLAFLAVSLVSTLLFGLLARYTTVREFQDYASSNEESHVSAALEEYYRIEGSWLGIQSALFYWRMPHTPGGQGMGPREVDPMTVADAHGVVVRAGPEYRLGEQLSSAEIARSRPLAVDGVTVGFLVTQASTLGRDPLEEAFLARFGQLLVYSALGAVAVSLLLGIFLSGTLSRPIRELTTATRAIADGDLSQQVPVRSRDELGALADSFNRMTAKLARSLHLRRQMTADIAHELRTPLSLILGHAEAVHDGVLPPSTENFEIIRDEASRLEHLVDDLRTLSLADAGELSFAPHLVAAENLLREVASMYQYRAQQQGIALEHQVEPGLPPLQVDSGRMTQVLTNILDNAFRHMPDGGKVPDLAGKVPASAGKIVLAAARAEGGVELSIQDSGPGVEADDLERIFDRFYRADPSRQRDGGSGLGLAIAAGEGLTITILLPALE